MTKNAALVAEPATLCSIASFYPPPLDREILRENFLDEIDRMLEAGIHIVFVDGEPEVGKTVLLSQYCRRHNMSVLPLFLSDTDALSQDSSIIQFELANQIEWLLTGTELTSVGSDPGVLRMKLFLLAREAKRKRTQFVFALDGLGSAVLRDAVLELLPVGKAGFAFVLGGSRADLKTAATVATKTLRIPGLSAAETAELLADVVTSRAASDDLYRLCQGIPGKLASVRRLIMSGVTADELLREPDVRAPELFEKEWHGCQPASQPETNALGLVAFDIRARPIEQLAIILHQEPAQLRTLYERCSFLRISSNDTVAFISDSFRRFVASKLAVHKTSVVSYVIEYLQSQPDEEVSLRDLPQVLESAGRDAELLTYLSSDRLSQLLMHSGALAPIKKYAERAHRSAYRVGGPLDLMLTSIQRAAILQIANAGPSVAEVKAYVALGDYGRALSLAQAAELREDRLQLLAVVAKAKKANSLPLDDELLETIKALAADIDPRSIGPRLIELAADLISVAPDVSLKLLETGYGDRAGGGALDWAFAAVSLSAMRGRSETTELPDIHERIQDSTIRKFATEGRLLFGGMAAEEVLLEIAQVPSSVDRISLLRSWAEAKRSSNGVPLVLDRALDLIAATPEYIVTAHDLRQLVTPLQYVTRSDVAERLVKRFDAHAKDLSLIGSSTEYARLQLLLALSEMNFAERRARDRIVETYYFINLTVDPHSRAESLSWVLKTMSQVDVMGELDDKDRVSEVATGELLVYVEAVLTRSAEHDVIIAPILRPLAKTRLSMALDIVRRLNTEPRRDSALLAVIESAVDKALKHIELDAICDAIGSITLGSVRDAAIMTVLQRIDARSADIAELGQKIWSLPALAEMVGSARERSTAYALVGRIIVAATASPSEASTVIEKAIGTWRRLDDGLVKIATGFELVQHMHKSNPDDARELLGEIGATRRQTRHSSEPGFVSFVYALRLAIRALGGLLAGRHETPSEIDGVLVRINEISDRGQRIHLFVALMFEFARAKRTDDAREVYSTGLRLVLSSIDVSDREELTESRVHAAPAIYATRPELLDDFLQPLESHFRDRAFLRVIRYVITGISPDEPIDGDLDDLDTPFDDLVSALTLCGKVEQDSSVYSVIQSVANSAARKNRHTRTARYDLAQRIESLAEVKFPNPRFIQHEGYALLAAGQAMRLRGGSVDEWEVLHRRVQNINNVADRAFVLAGLAQMLPSRDDARRDEWVRFAMKEIEDLPSAYEQAEHYVWMASALRRASRDLARTCLVAAMAACTSEDDKPGEMRRSQRQAIDLAYRIDPDFANTLAKASDDDPARKGRADAAQRRLEELRVKQQLTRASDLESLSSSRQPERIAEAAWLAIGSLHSKRAVPSRFDEGRPLLRAAGADTIERTYPLFALIVESAVSKYARSPRAREELRPLLDAALRTCDVVNRIFGVRSANIPAVEQATAAITLIESGERHKAFAVIEAWARAINVTDFKLCDPYFSLNDLDIIHLLARIHPTAAFHVVTSKKHNVTDARRIATEDDYRVKWADISELSLPRMEVVTAAIESTGESPIHDRWLLAGDAGLKFGGSLNGLGRGKVSDIRILTSEETQIYERQGDELLYRQERSHNGEAVKYGVTVDSFGRHPRPFEHIQRHGVAEAPDDGRWRFAGVADVVGWAEEGVGGVRLPSTFRVCQTNRKTSEPRWRWWRYRWPVSDAAFVVDRDSRYNSSGDIA